MQIVKVLWHDTGAIYYTKTHKLMVPASIMDRLTFAQAEKLSKSRLTRLVHNHGLKWARI